MRKISNHKNVIRLEGVLELTQESKCTIFLLMELANGGELFDRIKIDCGTREETATLYFQQLLSGVKHCHDQGVCHRDLKPENLLLQDTAGAGTVLKIADFGFSARFAMPASESRVEEEGSSSSSVRMSSTPSYNTSTDAARQHPMHSIYSNLSASAPSLLQSHSPPLRVLKSVVGSPFYVAPEVMQAKGYDGTKADVWSLGVILYAMLAGNLPFSQELLTCKRYRHFCKWVKEQQTLKGARFWETQEQLDYPQWLFPTKFSLQAKSLIVSMLHPDPPHRISVSEAMLHPLTSPKATTPPSSPFATLAHSSSTHSHHAATNAVPSSQPESLGESNEAKAVVLEAACMEQDYRLSFEDNDRDHDRSDSEGDTEIFRMEDDEDCEKAANDPQQLAETPCDQELASPSFVDHGQMVQSPFKPIQSSHQQSTVSMPSKPRRTPPPFASEAELAGPEMMMLHLPTSIDDLLTVSEEDDPGSRPTPTTTFSRGPGSTSPNGSRFSQPQFNNNSSNRLGSQSSSASVHSAGSNTLSPPAFNDTVKRSTRFITAVPAHEVLEKVDAILQDVKLQRTATPIGLIGRVELNWDRHRLEVWGSDTQGPALCSLQLYQMPAAASSSSITCGSLSLPSSPERTSFGSHCLRTNPSPNPIPHPLAYSPATASVFDGSNHFTASGSPSYLAAPSQQPQSQQLYLAEFTRGQLEIFAFKRFYQWVRLRLSELVKRDYSIKLFEQAASPMAESYMMQRF